MQNLLEETLLELSAHRKTPSDVYWVGLRSETFCSWKEFSQVANFDYNDGYGGQEINDDLMVVGKDWWLERHEYDGAEWWEFKKLPDKPENSKKITLDDLCNKYDEFEDD